MDRQSPEYGERAQLGQEGKTEPEGGKSEFKEGNEGS